MTKRDAFLWRIMADMNTPYRWGGDNPLRGFDCSGLVINGLQFVGILPAQFDCRAKDLYFRFPHLSQGDQFSPGQLIFWSRFGADSIHHVEVIAFEVEGVGWYTIGAGSGDSTTLTIERAIEQQAYVKTRPMSDRGMRTFFADPFA